MSSVAWQMPSYVALLWWCLGLEWTTQTSWAHLRFNLEFVKGANISFKVRRNTRGSGSTFTTPEGELKLLFPTVRAATPWPPHLSETREMRRRAGTHLLPRLASNSHAHGSLGQPSQGFSFSCLQQSFFRGHVLIWVCEDSVPFRRQLCFWDWIRWKMLATTLMHSLLCLPPLPQPSSQTLCGEQAPLWPWPYGFPTPLSRW